MTKPTEAEIEAARIALSKLCVDGCEVQGDVRCCSDPPCPCAKFARAALTAAAQVRTQEAIDAPLRERAEFLRVKAEIPLGVINCFLTGGGPCPAETSCSRCHGIVHVWLNGGKERYEKTARHAQFVEEHLYEHGVGSSDELGKCFPATEDYGESVLGYRPPDGE